jgi:hypothetical protein
MGSHSLGEFRLASGASVPRATVATAWPPAIRSSDCLAKRQRSRLRERSRQAEHCERIHHGQKKRSGEKKVPAPPFRWRGHFLIMEQSGAGRDQKFGWRVGLLTARARRSAPRRVSCLARGFPAALVALYASRWARARREGSGGLCQDEPDDDRNNLACAASR